MIETTIKRYSSLSTDTKPTLAAGNNIPNGSRWRNVDNNIDIFWLLIGLLAGIT